MIGRGLCPQGKSAVPSGSHANPSAHTNIEDGSLVRLKNGPPCGPNALVLQCSKTHGPRVGKTVNIMEHSSLDPVTSILVRVMKNTPLSLEDAVSKNLDDSKVYESLEVWKHSDVIFLDDSPAVLGRVVAVDSNQAIVDISQTQNRANESKSGKGSLKVFRVSEIEICVSTDFTVTTSSEKGNVETKSTAFAKKCSRHVAGIVQHEPTCIIDPQRPSQTISAEDSLEGIPSHSPLAGLRPITIHMTSEGPLLLVESLQNDQAYIITPAHSTSGLIQTSSYVALSARDQKPPHCTVLDEGCNCLESGLVAKIYDQEEPTTAKGKGRKRRLTQRDNETPQETPKVDHALFMNLYNSDIFCLRDVNGIPIPVPPGLKLRPVEHQCPDWLGGWSPMGQGKQLKLSNPYKCIMSNQYTTNGGNKKTLVLTIGKLLLFKFT